MDLLLSILLILVIMIFSGIMLWVVYKIVEKSSNNMYKQLPFHAVYVGSGKNMKICPKGCTRGVCDLNKYCKDHHGPKPKCCAFDFQCNYCKDPKTGLFYLEPGYNPKYKRSIINQWVLKKHILSMMKLTKTINI